MRTAFRFTLLAAMLAAPLLAIGQARSGEDRFIGESQRFSNGSGLVIAIGVSRP